MYSIEVTKVCGCMKKDKNLEFKEFESESEAELEALRLMNYMNKDYCKKHRFHLEKDGNKFIIHCNFANEDTKK